jgi:HipA-like C-terminal domain
VAELLRQIGTARDLARLALATLVNFLLGNSDAHAKNLSLLYDTPRAVRLAPLYDIVSTAVYPGLTRRLAMTVAGEDDPDRIDQAAWREMLRQAGFRPSTEQLRRNVAAVTACARQTLAVAKAEGWHRPLLDDIVQVAEVRAAQLAVAGDRV